MRLVHFGDVVRNVNVNVRDPLESGLERFVGLDHFDSESLHIKRWGLDKQNRPQTEQLASLIDEWGLRAWVREVSREDYG